MAKKPKTDQPQPAAAATASKKDLAFEICRRTGMGLTICRQRMVGHEDELLKMLEANDVSAIYALLHPEDKAAVDPAVDPAT